MSRSTASTAQSGRAVVAATPGVRTSGRGRSDRAESSEELQPGTRLGAYAIIDTIGHGASAVVYLAEHRFLSRLDALKVFRDTGDTSARERFVLESRLAALVEHPHVVPVYDAGCSRGRLYIAMRRVGGSDLHNFLRRRGVLDGPMTVTILTEIADALDTAHRRGLVHRDVKPANILIEADALGASHAFLTDFGIGWARTGIGRMSPETFAGTLAYASPEQLQGYPVDGRSDVYSLACVAVECLTGLPPYPATDPAARVVAHLSADPPSIRERRPGVPAGVDELFRSALGKHPSLRPGSAGEFVAALRSCLDGADVDDEPALGRHLHDAEPTEDIGTRISGHE